MIEPTDLKNAVESNRSLAGVVRSLKRATVGTNYRLIRREIERLGLDTSHWSGGSPDPHAQPKASSKEVLVENSTRPRNTVRKVVLREKLVPYQCAMCGSEPAWKGKPLTLRLDHKNGVRNDDRLENLRFLCPNCDSQTETFCGRNHPDKGRGLTSGVKRPCARCGEHLTFRTLCRSCAMKTRFKNKPQVPKIKWPPIEDLQARIATSSVLAVARELGVSDNAIRKHLRQL